MKEKKMKSWVMVRPRKPKEWIIFALMVASLLFTCRKYFQQADLVPGPASDALDGHRCASGSHHRIDCRLQMGGSLIWIS